MLSEGELVALYKPFSVPSKNLLLLRKSKARKLVIDCQANDLAVIAIDVLLYYGYLHPGDERIQPQEQFSEYWGKDLMTDSLLYGRDKWEEEKALCNQAALTFLDQFTEEPGLVLECVIISYDWHIQHMTERLNRSN